MSSIVETYVPLVFVLVIALTFHEFAHAWVAYKLGDDTAYNEGRVTLNPIVHLDLWGSLCFIVTQGFGWAKPVPVNPTNLSHPRRDDILITAAGPLSNLILAVISGLLFAALLKFKLLSPLSTEPLAQLVFRIMLLMVHVNLLLMVFNLLPLYPLDGSHIVTNLLPLNQAYQFKQFNESYGPMILLGLVSIGMMGQVQILSNIIGPPVRFLNTWIMKLAYLIF